MKTYKEHLARIQKTNPEVNQEHQEGAASDLVAIDEFMHGMSGTVVAIKTISQGQPRAYADSVYQSVIFAFRPNAYTTGGPAPAWLTRDQAAEIARTFVRSWKDDPGPFDTYLVSLERHPCPIRIGQRNLDSGRHPCWSVKIVEPYCD